MRAIEHSQQRFHLQLGPAQRPAEISAELVPSWCLRGAWWSAKRSSAALPVPTRSLQACAHSMCLAWLLLRRAAADRGRRGRGKEREQGHHAGLQSEVRDGRVVHALFAAQRRIVSDGSCTHRGRRRRRRDALVGRHQELGDSAVRNGSAVQRWRVDRDGIRASSQGEADGRFVQYFRRQEFDVVEMLM